MNDDYKRIEDYEEGTLQIKVKKHWYQFWLPKSISYGYFCKIGKNIKVTLIPNVYAGLTLMGEIDETFNDRQ